MRRAGLLLSAALIVALPTGAAAAQPLPSAPSLQAPPGWHLVASYGLTGPLRVGGDVPLRTGEPFAIIAACRGASELIVLLGPPPTDGVWTGRAFEFPCLPGHGPIVTTRFVVEQEEHPASLTPSPSASAAD